MKLITSLALTCAVLLAGCGKAVTVEGQAGTKLTLSKPSAVTLHRGEMAKLDIKITRRDLPGEVAIGFEHLPKGIDVVDAGNKLAGDSAVYTLRASDTADLVENSSAEVTATGPGGIAVTQAFNVTVKEKQP